MPTHEYLELVLEVLGVCGVAGIDILERGEAEAPVEVLVEGIHGHLEVHDAVYLLLKFRQHYLLRYIVSAWHMVTGRPSRPVVNLEHYYY